MKNKSNTTFQDVEQRLVKFREERNWGKYHQPKSIGEALMVEAGELMDHFLFKTEEGVIEKLKTDSEYREQVGEELADVMIYGINLAESAGFDLAEIIEDKISKNERRYPPKK